MSVSVIIPTYQRPTLLERAIASVRAQSVPVELVVVEDETPRSDYPADAHDFWCVKGVPPRNIGLDRATGDWVLTIDDDDELAPNAIERLLAATEGNDVAYGRSHVVGHGFLGSSPPAHSSFCNGAVLWRADMGYRFRMECPPTPADWDLWSRMLADSKRWTFVDEVVHYYYPAERIPAVSAA